MFSAINSGVIRIKLNVCSSLEYGVELRVFVPFREYLYHIRGYIVANV